MRVRPWCKARLPLLLPGSMLPQCSLARGKELWRRARLEFVVEWPLLLARWKPILFGAIFQYCHGIFTQLAHRMHRPQAQPLHDVGFELLPELGKVNDWVSELIFGSMFASFVLWSFSPFVMERKRFYTAVLYSRVLMVLVICQTLRIISFTVTQLPAPNYHCRLPEPTAVREWPEHWWGHLIVDVKRQSTHGCGDLIFSSHTTFALVGVMCYTEYGSLWPVKALVWLGAATLSFMIVASRKHYSVDVVVAWYVVPLVFYAAHRRWTTKRPLAEELSAERRTTRALAEAGAPEEVEIVVNGGGKEADYVKQPLMQVNGHVPNRALAAERAADRAERASSLSTALPVSGPVASTARGDDWGNMANGGALDEETGNGGLGSAAGLAGVTQHSGRKSPTTIMRPRSSTMVAGLPEGAARGAADEGSPSHTPRHPLMAAQPGTAPLSGREPGCVIS